MDPFLPSLAGCIYSSRLPGLLPLHLNRSFNLNELTSIHQLPLSFKTSSIPNQALWLPGYSSPPVSIHIYRQPSRLLQHCAYLCTTGRLQSKLPSCLSCLGITPTSISWTGHIGKKTRVVIRTTESKTQNVDVDQRGIRGFV